jgi:hypothetical protein
MPVHHIDHFPRRTHADRVPEINALQLTIHADRAYKHGQAAGYAAGRQAERDALNDRLWVNRLASALVGLLSGVAAALVSLIVW